MNCSQDTIVAISTAIGKGHRSILRLSGNHSIHAAASAVLNPQEILQSLGFRFHQNQLTFLEIPIPCSIYLMRAPKSYTREDIVEIHLPTTSAFLQTKIITHFVTQLGCRLAEPGEFTKRAFFNGRLSLAQAESVIRVINAKSDQAHRKALEALTGRVTNLINPIREKLFFLVRNLTVDLDFDEEIEEEHIEDIKNHLLSIQADIQQIAPNINLEQTHHEDIKLILCGPVNAGKSTIFNQLTKKNLAIVSPIKGTTRDIIKRQININEHTITIQDSPGWGEAVDEIDAIAQKNSQFTTQTADLILYILDGSLTFEAQKPTLIQPHAQSVIIINKADLPQEINLAEVSSFFQIPQNEFLLISGKTDATPITEHLKTKIQEIEMNTIHSILSTRQLVEFHQAQEAIQMALNAIDIGIGIDAIEFEVRRCLYALSRITGDEVDENILTSIFESFCIGK